MKIMVSAKTKSRSETIRRLADGSFEVRVRELPVDGKANEAIVKALAGYFRLPQSRIHLLHGSSTKHKIFSIDD